MSEDDQSVASDGGETRPGEPTRTGEGTEGFPHGSAAPFVLAAGIFGLFLGFIFPVEWIVGIPVFLAGFYLWFREWSIEEYERGVIPEQKRKLLGVSSAFLAGVFLVISEGLLFGGAFLAWYFLDFQRGPFPLSGQPHLNLLSGALMTFVLVIGSATMYWTRRGVTHGNRGRLTSGPVVTFVLGLVYLGLVWTDWSAMTAAGLKPSTGAFGATFYYLTGLHAAHVVVGLLLLVFLAYRAWMRGHFGENRATMVKVAEAYWHFLTGISVLILVFVYLPTS